MLEFLDILKGGKNLLGFSGGVDSVGLFFCLQEANIAFDIAIVDYGIRENSKEEVCYAKRLASQYKKKCFSFKAPQINSNFEAKAREIRYEFFEQIIQKFDYKNLILAHQLHDRLEWFLMQLTKGCGLNTLLGFDGVDQRENYQIVRPFFRVCKTAIYEYCYKHKYKFYEDITNNDMAYKRNEFRLKYVNDLMEEYAQGIEKSFNYLNVEKSILYPYQEIFQLGEILYFENFSDITSINQIDKLFKKRGYILSASQRQEILKNNFSCEVAQKYIIDKNQKYIFVTKLHTYSFSLPKKFKDIARKREIPKRIRFEIYAHILSGKIELKDIETYLAKKFSVKI
ncbi:tRNA lysidine(34) synthetase TilS [Helicobacter sp. 11S03491-1]|uniref:tRNA lysidine(34) synthetase TilS n=1 Tax=Helicobacter sp. 11S03491-1 TaxID=1476196 RepID=UPI000BA77347|nr:tRNA lysidine(34) synthetase TilS [Helicobacter sp. 11S03491-1]PAF42946.1 tRNA lysidine(34) synthetase TilS [Helicobacter sp. 11S03491-1]